MTKAKHKYHHGDLRRDLLRVAREQVSRHGAQSVSLASLARLAGVTQPAPYRHFADREALFAALATEGFIELTCHMREKSERDKGHVGWRAMALAYVVFGETNIELYRLMFASRLVPEAEPGSELAGAADSAFDLLRNAMQQVSKTSNDAYLIWAQLHGLVMLHADGLLGGSLHSLTTMVIS